MVLLVVEWFALVFVALLLVVLVLPLLELLVVEFEYLHFVKLVVLLVRDHFVLD